MGKVGPEPEQDQTGLVKIDTINRISVSKLDFTVPLPDGSPRKVLDGFSFDFSGPGTYCITGRKWKRKNVAPLPAPWAVSIGRQSNIQRHAD